MPYNNVKCRILEEEIRHFWPQWHVVRQISEGAFGAVYEIRKEEYGVQFRSALKVMHLANAEAVLPTVSLLEQYDNDGNGSDRSASREKISPRQKTDQGDTIPEIFRNEIKIMEALRGAPNVVTMEDVHFHNDGETSSLYIRMELLTSLQSYARSKPVLLVPEIIKIGTDVCRALSFCEERHIIHRDIKPANLFIDEYGTCKVGDFGASKRSETVHAAQMMTGIGTISYMAPEIYYGKPYNNTVDLYALGLVLYQLLNRGRMPFMPAYPAECTTADIDSSNYKRLHGEKIPQIFFDEDPGGNNRPVSTGNASDLNHLFIQHARALEKVIRRACAYRIGDRYSTAAEMSFALDACRHLPAVHTAKEAFRGSGDSGYTPEQDSQNNVDSSLVSKQAEKRSVVVGYDLQQNNNDGKKDRNIPISDQKDRIPESHKSKVNPERGKKDSKVRKNSDAVPARKRVMAIMAGLILTICLGLVLITGVINKKNSVASGSHNAGGQNDTGESMGKEEVQEDPPDVKRSEKKSASWEKIIASCKDGTYKEQYSIGDTAELDLGEEGNITMELVAMDADELADGSGKAHMTWIAKDLLEERHVMNTGLSTEGGWPVTDMRYWLRKMVLPLFPEQIASNILEVKKYSYSDSDGETISSVDSIWIPSRSEIFGDKYENEGVVYNDAYPDDSSRQKRHLGAHGAAWWWLRSANTNYYFWGVTSHGANYYDSANFEGGVVIGFCL